MNNAEKSGKLDCVVDASKLVESILKVMQENEMIGSYEFDDTKERKYRVELKGLINDCGAVKPRFSVAVDEYEKWEKRYLPAKNVGILIMTTPKGVISHEKAEEEKVGGQLIGYVY